MYICLYVCHTRIYCIFSVVSFGFLLFSPIFTEYRNFQQALTWYFNNSLIEFRIERVSTCSWALISLIGIRISDIFTFTVCGVHTHTYAHTHIYIHIHLLRNFFLTFHTHTHIHKQRQDTTRTDKSKQENQPFSSTAYTVLSAVDPTRLVALCSSSSNWAFSESR